MELGKEFDGKLRITKKAKAALAAVHFVSLTAEQAAQREAETAEQRRAREEATRAERAEKEKKRQEARAAVDKPRQDATAADRALTEAFLRYGQVAVSRTEEKREMWRRQLADAEATIADLEKALAEAHERRREATRMLDGLAAEPKEEDVLLALDGAAAESRAAWERVDPAWRKKNRDRKLHREVELTLARRLGPPEQRRDKIGRAHV